MKRLAIITTHPVQYNAPYFRMLSERGIIKVKVFYTWGESSVISKFDPGFGKVISWDIPLLSGYDYEFLENSATDQGSHHFNGIVNPKLLQSVQAWKPTAILIFGWSYRSHLRALRFFSGKIPVLFRGDSTLLDEPFGFSVKKLIRRIFLSCVYRYVDYALCVGKQNYRYFLTHGLKPKQLIQCPHAVDNDRFMKPDELYNSKAIEILKDLGINSASIVFLFAGKFEKKKNPKLLIEAFSELKVNNAHLFMVGNGELENELKLLSRSFSNIHFMDFQNQTAMPIVYRMADVFVLPSQGPGETWGLAANEAMASGCALLISNKCGASDDIIVNNENGFTFESGNKADLMHKMSLFIQAANLEPMKLASKKIIEDFSFTRICQEIEHCVNELVANE